jgi:hypothetical protein
MKISRRFNSVAVWVVKTIVDGISPKTRADKISKLIDIAYYIQKKHNNFSTVMALIAGLNKAPVSRLKQTWNEVPKAKMNVCHY